MNNSRKSEVSTARLLAALVLVAALPVVQSGCVAVVAAGAAGSGVAWYTGRLETTLNHSLEKTFVAAKKTVEQLEFAAISDRKSGVDAQILARTALDKKIDITLTKAGEKITKVQIRVGVFGEEALSLAILDKIKSNL